VDLAPAAAAVAFLIRIAVVSVVAILVVAIFSGSVASKYSYAPRLSTTPASGPATASVSVFGRGFAKGRFQLTWDGAAEGMPSVQVNGNGTFATTFMVPLSASAGAHVVGAISADGATAAATPVATVAFDVVVPTSTSAQPTASVAPTQSLAPTATPAATSTPAATASPATSPTATPLPAAAYPQPPQPPLPYAVPSGALAVRTSAELVQALAGSVPQDIVLAGGVYDNATYFVNANGHRVYAASLGGAVLRAGMEFGGNYGQPNGLVRGIAFDVSDPAKAAHGHIVYTWGTARGVQVLDSTFNGHAVMRSAVWGYQPEGLVVRRVQASNFTDFGVGAEANDPALRLSVPVLFEDIDVSGVSRAVPRSANGTAEACIWLANNGTLRRARVRNCAWMGIWTGGAAKNGGVLLEHLDIDQTPKGIYPEHYSWGATYQFFHIGPHVATGINMEWADPLTGGLPACDGCIVRDGTIESTLIGVSMDLGTARTSVTRVRFVGQGLAAIVDYGGIQNAYSDNDYSGLAAGAVPVSYDPPP